MRVVGELPIRRVKLHRFCTPAVVKSETWQGSKEETAAARKVEVPAVAGSRIPRLVPLYSIESSGFLFRSVSRVAENPLERFSQACYSLAT